MRLESGLEKIDADDVPDHIYQLYVERAPEANQDLGYVNRKKDIISIELPASGIELNIRQSLSQLASTTETSSTGFVCWRTSPRLVDWILTDPLCPFNAAFKSKNLDILELGTGVGAICASALSPYSARYICTDQQHILKLLKLNLQENVSSSFHSATLNVTNKTKTPVVEVVSLDWEQNDLSEYEEVTEAGNKPDLIIACDTIYNLYLIPYFVSTIKALMGPESGTLVAVQLRDESILESFISECIDQDLDVYTIPESRLSEELKHGFVVYYLRLQQRE